MRKLAAATIVSAALMGGPACAQPPAGSPPATPGAPPRADAPPPPKNLQFFPKDMTRPEVVQIMRGFSFALGVRCEHCHVDEGPGKQDFAADTKPAKLKARAMLAMTKRINDELLPAIPDRSTPPVRVSCVTCHHGVSKPMTLADRLRVAAADGGPDSTVATLKRLRDRAEFGRYDVSEWGVIEAARTLSEEDKTAEALAVLGANATFYPGSKGIAPLQAEIHAKRGEKAEAIAILRKMLAENPQDMRAKRLLEQLEGGGAAKP